MQSTALEDDASGRPEGRVASSSLMIFPARQDEGFCGIDGLQPAKVKVMHGVFRPVKHFVGFQ